MIVINLCSGEGEKQSAAPFRLKETSTTRNYLFCFVLLLYFCPGALGIMGSIPLVSLAYMR